MPDGSDRDAVAEFAASGAEILGNGRVVAGVAVARIWHRASSAVLAVQMANQLGMVFAGLGCNPRWRERLGQLTIPTLVVHVRRDYFFPTDNGEARARSTGHDCSCSNASRRQSQTRLPRRSRRRCVSSRTGRTIATDSRSTITSVAP